MINNKNQLKKALKENKNKIKIKRIFNLDEVLGYENKIKVGSIATVEKVQSNAFAVKYEELEKECWIYFENIEVTNNQIVYYGYLDDFNISRTEEEKKYLESKGIEVIKIKLDDKINKNRCSNYNYIYKYKSIINEILEV